MDIDLSGCPPPHVDLGPQKGPGPEPKTGTEKRWGRDVAGTSPSRTDRNGKKQPFLLASFGIFWHMFPLSTGTNPWEGKSLWAGGASHWAEPSLALACFGWIRWTDVIQVHRVTARFFFVRFAHTHQLLVECMHIWRSANLPRSSCRRKLWRLQWHLSQGETLYMLGLHRFGNACRPSLLNRCACFNEQTPRLG